MRMNRLRDKLNATFKEWLASVLAPTGHKKVAFTGNPNEYDDNNYYPAIYKIWIPVGKNWYNLEYGDLVNSEMADVDGEYEPTPAEENAVELLWSNRHSIIMFTEIGEDELAVIEV